MTLQKIVSDIIGKNVSEKEAQQFASENFSTLSSYIRDNVQRPIFPEPNKFRDIINQIREKDVSESLKRLANLLEVSNYSVQCNLYELFENRLSNFL